MKKSGKIELLKTTGTALGIMQNGDHRSEVLSVESGDCILFYTDGVTETMDKNNEEYGEKHLQNILLKYKGLSAQEIIDEIIKDLKMFNGSGSLQDDRTIMVLKYY